MRTTSSKCLYILFSITVTVTAQTEEVRRRPCAAADASVSMRDCGATPFGAARSPRFPAPSAAATPRRAVAREASVSLARLRNAPPLAAQREVERANERFAKQQTEAGIRRLEKAIEIHSDFIEARNNLGVHYMRGGRALEAVAQFERVLELDPSASRTWANLSFALYELQRLEEARFAAVRAVDLDPRSPSAHLSLGRILLAQGRESAAAVDHLRSAADAFPRARLLAADALLALGEPKQAREQLRLFLAPGVERIR